MILTTSCPCSVPISCFHLAPPPPTPPPPPCWVRRPADPAPRLGYPTWAEGKNKCISPEKKNLFGKGGKVTPSHSQCPPNIADRGSPPGPLGSDLPPGCFGGKCGEFPLKTEFILIFPLFFGSLMSSALAAAAAAVTIFTVPERRRRRRKTFQTFQTLNKRVFFFPPTSPSGPQTRSPLPCQQRPRESSQPRRTILFDFLLLFFSLGSWAGAGSSTNFSSSCRRRGSSAPSASPII